MRVGLVVVALIGCSGSGVDVEILGDGATFDRVELYITYDKCSDCANGIAWPNATTRPDGTIYFFRDEHRVEAKVTSPSTAVIHLAAESGDFTHPVAIAVVGYTGSQVTAVKILRDVDIPMATGAVWRVYMHHATPVSDDVTTVPPEDPTYRALMWPRENPSGIVDPAGCVAYQKFDASIGWVTEYFVPQSDPDCDGLAPECSPYWYRYNTSQGDSYCVTPEGSELAGSCRIGTSLCADGFRDSSDCVEELSRGAGCVLDKVCLECGTDVPVETCLAQVLGAPLFGGQPQFPHSECPFHPDLNSIDGLPCPGSIASLTVPASSSVACTSVLLHSLRDPIDNGNSAVAIDTLGLAKVEAHVVTGIPCTIEVLWKQGRLSTISNAGTTILAEMVYENGNRIYWPIHIVAANAVTCPASPIATNCTTRALDNAGEKIFACIR